MSGGNWWTGLALIGGLTSVVYGCGDEPPACIEDSECGGLTCRDGLCVGSDAGARDAAAEDSGADGIDGGPGDAGLPPPLPPARIFEPEITMQVRDAVDLGDGRMVVGRTPMSSLSSEGRQAIAFHYGADGAVRWAKLIGERFNDQFLTAASDGTTALAGGLTRSYPIGDARSTDVLLIDLDASGPAGGAVFQSLGNEVVFGLVPGGDVGAWIAVGYQEATPGENRNALIFALDEDLELLWAQTFDAGENEAFYDAAVVGSTVYVTGRQTNESRVLGLVAAVTVDGAQWSKTFGSTGASNAVSIRENPADGTIWVSGGIGVGDSAQPLVLRMLTDGTVLSADRYDVGGNGRASNFLLRSGQIVLAGERDAQPFLAALNPGGDLILDEVTPLGEGLRAVGFRPVPLANGELTLQAPLGAVVELPFRESGAVEQCAAPQQAIAAANVTDQLRDATWTRAEPTLARVAVTDIRDEDIFVASRELAECPFVVDVDRSTEELRSFSFTPAEADPETSDTDRTEQAWLDTRAEPRGELVVYLHGAGDPDTCGSAEHGEVLAGMGFHVVAPCYSSGYGVGNCGDDIGGCRREAFEGVDHHPFIDIAPPEGAERRVARALSYLASEDPTGGWDAYLEGDAPRWSRIVVSGISHGASSSGVIAMHRPVRRVVMLSGPLDSGQSWLEGEMMVPREMVYGFSHTDDPQHPGHLDAFDTLGLMGAATSVDGAAPPYGRSRRLISSAATANGHGSTRASGSSPRADGEYVFAPVWRLMYTGDR